MDKNYFKGEDLSLSLRLGQRVYAFYTEIHTSEFFPADFEEAHMLLEVSLFDVENSAKQINRKVWEKNGKIIPFEFRAMWIPALKLWEPVHGFPNEIKSTWRTHQYIFIGANGAIEIHQRIEGVDLSSDENIHIYQSNDKNTLVLKRPGGNCKDVWGNYLFLSEEEFSKRKEQKGMVKAQ